MPHIYSTLSADVSYTKYDLSSKDLPRAERAVLIKGGTGISNKNLVTPLGVHTQVTNDELEFLKSDEVFLMHMQNGYIKIGKAKVEPEIVAADMVTRDNSAPVVPQDSNESDAVQPSGRKNGIVKNNLV